MICSKLFTDTNINFKDRTVRHCCKQTPYSPTDADFDRDGDMFEQYDLHVKNKYTMLAGVLPDSCIACKDGMFRDTWNRYPDDFQNSVPRLAEEQRTEFIELDLGDACDLACTYCGWWNSTTWRKQLGMNVTPLDSDWQQRIIDRLVERIQQLQVRLPVRHHKGHYYIPPIEIAILGGEPTLMPHTWEILDTILPHLEQCTRPIVSITTNLNTGDALMDRFLNTVERYNRVEWRVGISIENWGVRAEQVRHGLDWHQFCKNLQRIQNRFVRTYIVCTHNYLSLPYYADFVEWIFANMHMPYASRDHAWEFTNNAVLDGACSVEYIREQDVDWDHLYATLEKYNVAAPVKDHMDNIRKRSGRSPDKIYTQGMQLLLGRNPKLTEHFPHIRLP